MCWSTKSATTTRLWPTSPDGGGTSLNRLAMANYGQDPANWDGRTPSPGNLAFPQVVGRNIFYNNSAWDGNEPAANADDDGAIATDKTALLPGGTASFANYSSFDKGITGIKVDVAAPAGAITVADFEFKTGNTNDTGTWTPLAVAPTVTVRIGAGVGGSDRVSITWPDGTIRNTWLEVTVLATAATGLAADDVFYFGSAVGETGNLATNALVNAADEIRTRVNPRNLANPAPIDFRFDFNRDRLVDATDQIIARTNSTSISTALRLIVPAPSAGALFVAGALADAALVGDGEPDDMLLLKKRR